MEKLETFYHKSDVYEEMLKGHDKSVYQEYVDFIEMNVKAGSSLLDAGCGVGLSTQMLAKHFKVTGSEYSPKFIATARKNFPDLTFNQDDLTKLPYKDSSFDGVSCYNVIEHIPEPAKALKEMVRVLKKDGVLVIYAPNLLSPMHALKTLIKNQNQTYDGRKTKLGLIGMMFRSCYWLLLKDLGLSKDIIQKKVILEDFYADQDAVYYCNPIDVKHMCQAAGATVVSYQSLAHLKKNPLSRLFFTLFPNVSGSVRIAVKKN